jgi:hypothetical protein
VATPAAIWASPPSPAQQLRDVEADLLPHEPRGVPGGDEREGGEGLAVEGRPRDQVHLLVVVRDQGQLGGSLRLDHLGRSSLK